MIHDLKCWPIYFEAILDGTKTFEVRQNDRDFKVGDYLLLREFNVNEYTGREQKVLVTYLMSGPIFGIYKEYVAMAVSRCA